MIGARFLVGAMLICYVSAQEWTEHTDPYSGRTYYCANSACTWDASHPALPNCGENELRISYTRCEAGERSLVYYFDSTSGCAPNANELPPPITNLPCNVTCAPGEHLRAGASSCSPCEPGSFSIGGGKRYMGWKGDLPTAFKTYVTTTTHAPTGYPGWITQDGRVNSGDLANASSVDSYLELGVELVRAGTVSFTFKVDAEKRYDGLTFWVDGELFMSMVSYQFEYATKTFELTAGFHNLVWKYSKDFTLAVGADRAFISDITVLGTHFNDPECTKCPAGYFSGPKAQECSQCPSDKVAQQVGSGECVPCSTGTFAPPGAAVCLPRPPCEARDTTVVYTKCDGERRTKKVQFTEPKICQGGIALPPDESALCPPCDPGKFRDGTSCAYCPDGTFSSVITSETGTQPGCAQCPARTVAQKVRYYDAAFSPDEVEGDFSTGCRGGICGANGWRFLGDRMDSGVNNGDYVDIWLNMPVTLINPGDISFNYSVFGYATFEFTVDGSAVRQMMYTHDGISQEFRHRLTPGEHTLGWSVHKTPNYPWSVDGEQRAEIYSIVVTGVQVGGAVECRPCPPGSVSPPGSIVCTPCSAGTHQVGTECRACPENTFSAQDGATACVPCGHGTFSEPQSTECSVPTMCLIDLDPLNIFDIRELGKELVGPVTEVNRTMDYFFSMCSSDHKNDSHCVDKDGEPMTTYACQMTGEDEPYNLGKRLAYDINENDELIVTFWDGTSDRCETGRKTHMRMICDPDAGRGFPNIPSTGAESEHCVYNFEWRSKFGCRVCDERDQDEVIGECLPPGKQEISYFWKQDSRCHGGVTTETRHDECQEVVVYKRSWWLIFMLGVSCVGTLVGGLFYLYWKNRQIYKQYNLLKEQNEADLELERYTLDDDDDCD